MLAAAIQAPTITSILESRLNDLPVISKSSQTIFESVNKQLEAQNANRKDGAALSFPTNIYSLKSSVEDLISARKQLKKAQGIYEAAEKTKVRDRLLNVLASALLVGVLVGGILGGIALGGGSGAGIAIIISSGLLYLIACAIFDFVFSLNGNGVAYKIRAYISPLISLVTSPLLPLYHAVKKVSYLKSIYDAQSQRVNAQVKQIEADLKNSINYFAQNPNPLVALTEILKKNINESHGQLNGHINNGNTDKASDDIHILQATCLCSIQNQQRAIKDLTRLSAFLTRFKDSHLNLLMN